MKTVLTLLFSCLLTCPLLAQVPLLNSYPTAQATLYLDFDGMLVQGTAWNWSGPIQAQASGLTEVAIEEIVNRVAEDFRIFNLNITTDSTVFFKAPLKQRMRVLVTPTYQWYGMAGGVSFVGSFTWGDDTPAWVFSGLLNNKTKNIAEAISHEAGHTMGLQHQSTYDGNCNKTAEYSGGQGNGEIGWAPIMGVGYYKNLTTWYYGTNAVGCNVLQNDINILAGSPNNFGLRSDDHGNISTQASPINFIGGQFSAGGIINNNTDRDVFSFTLNTATSFTLNAIPENVGNSNSGANVDIRITLLNQQADTIGRYNPSDLLSATIDSNLNSGTYYLVIDGVGNVNLPNYKSVGYYILSGNIGTPLALHHFILTATASQDVHHLSWRYAADEPVLHTVVEYSKEGTHFTELAQIAGSVTSFSWKPADYSTYYYRVKAVTANDKAWYSNIMTLRKAGSKALKVLNNFVTQSVTIQATAEATYQLTDETGRLVQAGRLSAGTNVIRLEKACQGLLVLRMQQQGAAYTEKLMKQ